MQPCRVCWDVGKVPMRNIERKLRRPLCGYTRYMYPPDAMVGIASELREVRTCCWLKVASGLRAAERIGDAG